MAIASMHVTCRAAGTTRASMQLAYHYVGTGRAIAAYVPLRRRHGGTRLAPTRARPSLDRRHSGTPARGRLVHRRRTPQPWRILPPRISTTYAPCGTTRQTTYCYDERTITYARGRVAGPSAVTLRNSCTFVILRTVGTAGRTAGTRLAIRPGHKPALLISNGGCNAIQGLVSRHHV